LAQNTDDDVLQALQLFISLRPEFQTNAAEALGQEPLRRYSGTVTNFNRDKGFGFIQSEDVSRDFGKDVFVSDREIGHFNVGDSITFTVVVNKDNKPQARLLKGLNGELAGIAADTRPTQQAWGAPTGYQAQTGYEPPAKIARTDASWGDASWGGGSQWGAAPPAPPPAVRPMGKGGAAAGAQEGARYVGTITSFMPEKRFGFITSEALSAHFGKDTFLSDLEIGNFKVGDTISFMLAIKNGRPQARQLQPSSGEAPQPASEWAAFGDAGVAAQAGGGDPTRYQGTITNFMPEKRFGFIACEELSKQYGKDTFLSDLEIGENTVGSTVTFRMELNKRGQPQARDLAPAGMGGELSGNGWS